MEDIKEMLLQEKAKIEAQLKNSMKKTHSFEHDIGDAIDTSVEEQERDFTILLQDRDNNKLGLIEDALQRIKIDDYGYCEECGEEISKKRLLAVPFTRFCVPCQQEIEKSVGGKVILNTMGESQSFGED
ncbi:TraR/DksA family transcriptional regulator [Deltaproteobacteria bacterium TL4]